MADKLRPFVVKWDIEIVAKDAKDAAEQALAIHRDPESIATAFKVYDKQYNMTEYIDLTYGTD